jgi:hypothetical protein
LSRRPVPSGRIAVILTVAAVLVAATAGTAVAATTGRIHGIARSAYSGAPLGGISAGLYSAADDSLAYETTTTAAGAYDFAAVAPGDYWLLLDDVTGRYWRAFWDQAETTDTATPVSITDTETVRIDPTLDPVVTNWVWFDFPEVSGGYSDIPYVSQPIRIEVRTYDLPEPGQGAQTIPRVDWSEDDVTWSPWTGTVERVGADVFAISVRFDTEGPRAFRFAWDDSEFVRGDTSFPAYMYVEPDLTEWTSTMATGGKLYPTGPRDYYASLEATLTAADGLPDTTSPAILQTSQDGSNWTDLTPARPGTFYVPVDGGPDFVGDVSVSDGGRRSCVVRGTHFGYFRYRAARFAAPGWIASAPAAITPNTWMTCINRTPYSRLKQTFTMYGALAYGHVGEPINVEVQKPRSKRWSYSSKRLIYAVASNDMGLWSYKYKPKTRGVYHFRARYAGGRSGAACVSGIGHATVY